MERLTKPDDTKQVVAGIAGCIFAAYIVFKWIGTKANKTGINLSDIIL